MSNKPPLQPLLTPAQRTALFGTWRHKGTGHIYHVTKLGRIEATLGPGVVYERRCPTCWGPTKALNCEDTFHDRPEEDPWIRPYDEFIDGRFEKLG